MEGLQQLTVEKLAQGLQSGPGNEMAGIEGRAQLLLRLGKTLGEKVEFFGEDARPGNMLGGSLVPAHKRNVLTGHQTTSYPIPPPRR